ncbi:MAG TPA: Arc family DNA-binding protein [Candidatus Acidoferrales bacterium]|nr:Arc family DNA-binding protein [Candidatus Acidoferrales bacterium]
MATLYVENVPKDVYQALRERAKRNHRSIAAEVLSLFEQFVPTKKELKARREFVRKLARLRSLPSPGPGPFPSTEEMQREDRAR